MKTDYGRFAVALFAFSIAFAGLDIDLAWSQDAVNNYPKLPKRRSSNHPFDQRMSDFDILRQHRGEGPPFSGELRAALDRLLFPAGTPPPAALSREELESLLQEYVKADQDLLVKLGRYKGKVTGKRTDKWDKVWEQFQRDSKSKDPRVRYKLGKQYLKAGKAKQDQNLIFQALEQHEFIAFKYPTIDEPYTIALPHSLFSSILTDLDDLMIYSWGQWKNEAFMVRGARAYLRLAPRSERARRTLEQFSQ